MTHTIDLDDKIRDLLDQLDQATPAPPAFAELHHYGRPSTSRLVPLIGAAAVAVIGVGGLVAVAARNDAPASESGSRPASTAEASDAESQAAAAQAQAADSAAVLEAVTGPLLSTPLGMMSTPLVVIDQPGWKLTGAFGQVAPTLTGGFEGSTVLVGDGPRYDAPLFAATVVETAESSDTTQVTTPSASTLLQIGEPIAVAGTTGSVLVTETDGESGLDGPIVVLFWPLDDNHVARVNAVRLSVADVVAMANQLALVDGSLTMTTPDGYQELDTPVGGDRRHISYQFSNGDTEFELNGENRGAASLLGRIAGEVRTTRVVDDTEVAYRPLPDLPGEYWVDWQAGDWSFYVIASGFADEDAFLDALSSLTLADPATFEATGGDIDLVMPGQHPDLANQVLSLVELTDAARLDAATTELPMSLDSYAFELFQGATCAVFADWSTAVNEGDERSQAELTASLAATVAAATGTGFERAATSLAAPLLATMNGDQPTTEYTTECPGWAR